MAQVSLQELRLIYQTSQSQTYANAATATWTAGTATKLRVLSVVKDGLTEAGIPDTTLQTRLHGAPAPLVGLRTGSLKVTTYLGGGSSSNVADPYCILVGKVLGNIAYPGSKTTICNGATVSTTSNIMCSNALTAIANGMGVLIGTEARVATNVQSGWFALNMALTSAPANGTTVTVAHSAYQDELGYVTPEYIDFLALGKSTTDQRQGIGCQATAKLSGLAPGEAAKVELDLMVSDHQVVPVNERATLSTTTAVSGNDPPTGKAAGGFMFGDYGVTTRVVPRAVAFDIDPGVAWSQLADPNKLNGIGGWLRNASQPKASFTMAMDEDHLGLVADFEAKTAKQFLLQLGSVAGKCVAVYMPKCYLDSAPVDAAFNNEAGLKLALHGEDDVQSSKSGDSTGGELSASSISIHWF